MDMPLCVRRWDPVSPAPWGFPEWVCLSIPEYCPISKEVFCLKKRLWFAGIDMSAMRCILETRKSI